MGKHGPVRQILKNGVLVDRVLTLNQVQAEVLRGQASQSELRVAIPFEKLGFEHSVAFHGFVLDFFNERLKVCIEIDGPQHAQPDNAKRDKCRDAALRAYGVRTWRFEAYFARGNPDGLVAYVTHLLKRMVPEEFEA